MSIIQVLRILLARRWVVVITLGVCFGAAVIVGLLLPPRYPAAARVLLDNFKPDPVTGQMISPAGLRSFTGTQLELIKDYRIAGEAVDKLGLTNNAALVAAWQSDTGGFGDFRRWVADRIVQRVEVRLLEGSNIMEITYEGPEPEVARRTVNALREAYIDNALRFRTDPAGRTAEWYAEQTERALRALQTAEAAKTRFEQENGIVMTEAGEAESVKLAGLQQALNAARSNVGLQQYEVVRQASVGGIVDNLKLQLAQLSDQMGQAAERLGEQHPTYQALLARRRELERQLAREQVAARRAGQEQLGATRGGIASLEQAYEQQRAKVFAMKDKLDRLAQLKGEVDLRRSQYEQAAKRTAELRLESNVADAGLIVLGDATVAPSPSFPNWTQILLLSAAGGLGLGLLLALVVELLNRRVRGAEDLGFAVNAPVLAIVAERRRPSWRRWLKRQLSRGNDAQPDLQPAQ
jgi:uncharacterized protein involved in exopolysaccharide biosynthesis